MTNKGQTKTERLERSCRMCAEAERLMRTPWPVNSPRTLEIPPSPLQNSYQKPLFFPPAPGTWVWEQRSAVWPAVLSSSASWHSHARGDKDEAGGKRAGMGGWVGGGVKRWRLRWGRAHSVESLSCGAPRIFFFTDTQNHSVWSAERACPGASVKRMRQDPAGGPKDQKLFPAPVLNKGKMLFSAISPSLCLSLSLPLCLFISIPINTHSTWRMLKIYNDCLVTGIFIWISAVRSQHFTGGVKSLVLIEKNVCRWWVGVKRARLSHGSSACG